MLQVRAAFLFLLVSLFCGTAIAQSGASSTATATAQKQTARKVKPRPAAAPACAACIRAEMDFLASDAMQGRGSATHDELVAATYVGSELERYGVQPAGDKGTYIQAADDTRNTIGILHGSDPKL